MSDPINDVEYDKWEQRLRRIFIRVQDANGKWQSISCYDATPEQFSAWFGRYIATRVGYPNDPTLDKAAKISLLDDINFTPVEVIADEDTPEQE